MRLLLSVFLIACAVLPGCSPAKQDDGPGGLRVFVSTPPLAYLAERIAGDRANVTVIAKSETTPYTSSPDTKLMTAAQEADIYFATGMPIEQSVLSAIRMSKTQTGSKKPEIVSTQLVAELLQVIPHGGCERQATMVVDGHEGHGHGADCGHGCAFGHGKKGPVCASNGKDPHVWLSPAIAILQARRMTDALAKTDPEGKATYEANFAALKTEIEALDRKLAAALAPAKGKAILVTHPAWQYFASAYGVTQKLTPEKEKMPAGIKEAKASGVKLIFLSPRSDAAVAMEMVKAIDGVVIPADPFARDYVANLTAIAEAIEKALPQ